MHNRFKSLIGGTAIAALLVLPSFAASSPPAPPTPPAPPVAAADAPDVHDQVRAAVKAAKAEAHAQAAAARAEAHAAAADMRDAAHAVAARERANARAAIDAARPVMVADAGTWKTWPQKKFNVNAVKFEDIVGTVIVEVKNGGPMTLDVSGMSQRVNAVHVDANGGTLVITTDEVNDVWNWQNWFDFSGHDDRGNARGLILKVGVPKGASVNVSDLVGEATIGDTWGPLRFEAAASRAKIGHVGKAYVSLAGSGKVDIAGVNGPLHLEIAGSGKISTGAINGPLNADIAGAGTAAVGNINGGLNLDIAGSGDITAASVKGRTSVDIAGSGSVKIATGTADPLHVDIIGSGNFDFGGVAVNPSISAIGSGSVKLNTYRGKLSSDGAVTVKVNGKTVTVGNDDHDRDDDDE